VRRHEPDAFRRTRKVLLPKAYPRLALTGETIEDMSDASGTLWLDVGRRCRSGRLLAATGLDRSPMPASVLFSPIYRANRPLTTIRTCEAGSRASATRQIARP
jgi:sugar (pentulose or hexulose) kinase